MHFTHRPKSEAEANSLLQSGQVQFVVTIPSDFTRRLVRGERAQVLIDTDATDPMAAANPLAAAQPAIDQALTAKWGRFGDLGSVLKEPLESIRGDYDYIFLDTAPNLTTPTIAAYKAADFFLLSAMPETFAMIATERPASSFGLAASISTLATSA